MNNQYGMVMTLSNIGGIHMELKDYKKANEYLKQGYDLAKAINDPYGLAVNLAYLAYLNNEQKKYVASNKLLEEELEVLGEHGDVSLKLECYSLMGQNYEAIGNYKEALKYSRLFNILDDSLYNVETGRQIQELETQYEVSKKETQNKLLQAEAEIAQKQNRNRTFVILGLVIILLLIAGWSSYIYRANQEKNKMNEILETKVKERTKELEQANYELRTFNYIASHDIKEPIRNVGNYAGLIFRKLPDDLKNSLGSYFDTIKRSTSQLYTLVEDFARYTTLSKNDAIEQQEVNLSVLIKSVEENLEETISKYNGQVVYDNLPIISSSSSLLYTAFKNLIENGLKYNQSEQPTVKINYYSTETHHQFIVSDNGIGIEKQYHDKIFEMFKRLHNRGEYEGSGIGLAIVKLVTEKLSGIINVKSDKKGSQFILSFPKK